MTKNIFNFMLLGVLLMGISTFVACDKKDSDDTANVELIITPTFGAETFELNKNYVSPEGQVFYLSALKFYLSNISLINSDGTEESLNEVLFFKQDSPETYTVEVPQGNYTGLHLGVGLDSLLNTSDPDTFQAEHPLSYAQNTHWTWVSKYRFFIMDGRVDTIENNMLEKQLRYHTGFDEMYRETTFNQSINVDGDIKLELKVDIEKVLKNVSMYEQNITDSLSEIGIQISDNVKESLELTVQ